MQPPCENNFCLSIHWVRKMIESCREYSSGLIGLVFIHQYLRTSRIVWEMDRPCRGLCGPPGPPDPGQSFHCPWRWTPLRSSISGPVREWVLAFSWHFTIVQTNLSRWHAPGCPPSCGSWLPLRSTPGRPHWLCTGTLAGAAHLGPKTSVILHLIFCQWPPDLIACPLTWNQPYKEGSVDVHAR